LAALFTGGWMRVDIRILLTVRADYFNLVSALADAAGEPMKGADGKTPIERLTVNSRAAILPLKRISDAGLPSVVPTAAITARAIQDLHLEQSDEFLWVIRRC
jgi:hypothetical protein